MSVKNLEEWSLALIDSEIFCDIFGLEVSEGTLDPRVFYEVMDFLFPELIS